MTQAFIFARGGSKGLTAKNLRPIMGQSLLSRAIETARMAPSIDRVVVSTDCVRIAEESVCCAAAILNRPPELATDEAPEWLSWQHAVDAVRPDLFVSVPCVCPLRTAFDIEACIARFREGGADIVLTVTEARANPYFVMARDVEGGLIRPLFNEGPKRRQDAPHVHQIFAGCYVADPEFIRSANSIWDGKVAAVQVPAERSVDIDTELDLRFAELLMRDRDVMFSSVQ